LVSTDGGHGSQIAVLVQPEVVLSSSDSLDIFCKILTLSDGYIGYLGVSVWITGGFHIGHISNGKDVIEPLNPIYTVYLYSSATRNGRSGNPFGSVCDDTGRPDNASGTYRLSIIQRDLGPIVIGHCNSGLHDHAHLSEIFFGIVLREAADGRQGVRAAVKEVDVDLGVVNIGVIFRKHFPFHLNKRSCQLYTSSTCAYNNNIVQSLLVWLIKQLFKVGQDKISHLDCLVGRFQSQCVLLHLTIPIE